MSVGKKKSRRNRRANGVANDAVNGDAGQHSGCESDSDEDPDVEDIDSTEICQDNHTTCVEDDIDAVLEVFDEETCVNLLIGYYEGANGVKLDETTTSCKMSGCEHDYSSNTFRLMVELSSRTGKLSDHFIIIKIDPATGFPKVCGLK